MVVFLAPLALPFPPLSAKSDRNTALLSLPCGLGVLVVEGDCRVRFRHVVNAVLR
jgi:hypothetical protein